MLTERENFLMCLRGEQPEWVPMYCIDYIPGTPRPNASHVFWPPIIGDWRNKGGGIDMWGVEHVPTYETGGALLPKPGVFILKDITKWRDIIKAPDISHIDWEMMAKKHMESYPVDPKETAIGVTLTVGFFQNLVSFMGFTEGMCAMYEDPEEVYELLDYICSFYEKVADNILDFYNPDILTLMDDTAAWLHPFISPTMFRTLLLPFYDRLAKFGRERGLPISFHNCGKCEAFLDDYVSIGVTAWDPAQTCNDLSGIKKKYGNKLVLLGGWDARGRLLASDVTDEEIRNSIQESLDKYAGGGGYAILAGYIGPVDDREILRKNIVVLKAIDELGRSFYQN